MKLSDLEKFQEIVIQCHDNPDADRLHIPLVYQEHSFAIPELLLTVDC